MKTPFDTVLKIERRAVDAMRVAIGRQAEAIDLVESAARAVDSAVKRERLTAAADWTMSSDAYFARQRAERRRLEQDRAEAETQMTLLRARAAELYGTVRAIETAADDWRHEAEREAEAKIQAESDDFAASRFARALQIARSAQGRPDSGRHVGVAS